VCVCVCVCLHVRTITFERNDLWPIHLTGWFSLKLSESSSMVTVVDHSSRSKDMTSSGLPSFDTVCANASFNFRSRWSDWRIP